MNPLIAFSSIISAIKANIWERERTWSINHLISSQWYHIMALTNGQQEAEHCHVMVFLCSLFVHHYLTWLKIIPKNLHYWPFAWKSCQLISTQRGSNVERSFRRCPFHVSLTSVQPATGYSGGRKWYLRLNNPLQWLSAGQARLKHFPIKRGQSI